MDILYLCKSVFFLWCLLCVEALLCSVRGFQQSAPNHDVYMTLFKPELKKKKRDFSSDNQFLQVLEVPVIYMCTSQMMGKVDILMCGKMTCSNE